MLRNCLSSLLRSRTAGPLVLALFVGLSLTACDQSSQNIEYTSGSNLTLNTISGPGFIPNYDSTTTAEYQIRTFTLDRDYQWSVSGVATQEETRRQGENLVVSTSTPGSYTVTATTTIDGEQYSGSVSETVDYPTASQQAGRYNTLATFGSVVGTAGLAPILDSDASDSPLNGWTAFAPSNTAFLNALDADGNGEIGGDELPATGVLAKVLQYHVTPDSLTASDISTQTPQTVLHPEETLTLNGSAGTVEGTNQTVNLTTTDIATSDGVLHVIDGVLLPGAVVSINEQTAARENGDDVVAVEGTYVQDGGFIALHEGSPTGDIIGVSEKLDPGFHGNTGPIEITLDSQLSDTTNIVAMPHVDDPSDGQFTFPSGDPAYTRGSSSTPVVDSASVAPSPME